MPQRGPDEYISGGVGEGGDLGENEEDGRCGGYLE